jgi:RNA polymerase sigma-70 factor (ECF subfamily)
VIDGNEDVWSAAALEQNRRMLVRYVLASTGDPAITDDMVQDTLRIAYEHRDKLRPGSDLGAWLRGIARNVLRRHFRNLKKAPILTGAAAGILDRLCGEQEQAFADEEWQEQRIRAMKECLAGLSAKARRMFTERYGNRQTSRRVASLFGMTVSAVNVMMFRVRGALARCVQKRMEAWEA